MIRLWPLPAFVVLFAFAGLSARAQAPVVEAADRILDPALPAAQREKAVNESLALAPELIAEMAKRIAPDGKNEYDLIPWIWRVANRAAKRGDADLMRRMMDASMPAGPNDPLRDWQCVVLGGGVVMGIADMGRWAGARVAELLEGQPAPFAARWERSLDLAIAMSHNEPTPPPTRYDALRMLCVLPFDRAQEHLVRYLAPGTEPEVQLGAVLGLADLNDDRVAAPLIEKLGGLAERNREAAIKGLTRTPGRATALLAAVESGRVARAAINAQRERELRNHADPKVRELAARVLGEAP